MEQPVQYVSDEQMAERRAGARSYTVAILREGPSYHADGARDIIWEHGRRNYGLRADGRLAIVLPILDDTSVCGVGVFALGLDETREVMEHDPAVEAGVLVFDVHPSLGFPGDALPG